MEHNEVAEAGWGQIIYRTVNNGKEFRIHSRRTSGKFETRQK
jgi:hypothetical protein